MGNIIQLPEYLHLGEEVATLRARLSALLFEKNDLLLHVCKNIEARYILQLGGKEYKVYQLYCQYMRQRRKLQYLQEKVNRQEPIQISAIDKQLDQEFEEYQRKIQENIDKVNDALQRTKAEALSAEDNAQLKKIYRAIVKAVHPDLHPGQPQSMVDIFTHATQAYENGDLAALQLIFDVLGSGGEVPDSVNSLEETLAEKIRLEEKSLHWKKKSKRFNPVIPTTRWKFWKTIKSYRRDWRSLQNWNLAIMSCWRLWHSKFETCLTGIRTESEAAMSDLIKPENQGFLALINHPGGMEIPEPFEQEIYLFDTHVAGTTHVENLRNYEHLIKPGEKLEFYREPDNQHDPMAIKVQLTNGVKVGYVPMDDNIIFSRLMDAGKLLFGRIMSMELKGSWHKIQMKVYLKD